MNNQSNESDELPDIPELEALVQGYRAETHRSAAQVDAALHAVRAQVGTSAAATTTGLSTATKVGIAAALAGVVGVVGFALFRPDPAPPVAPHPVVSTADPTPAPAAPVAPPVDDPVDAVVTPPAEQAEPVALPPTEPPRAQPKAPKPTTKPKRPRAKPAPAPASKPAPQSTLAEELRRLQAIRAALRSGNPTRTRTLIDAHRRDYPDSTLARERDATEVTALCAEGRTADAERKASAFSKRYPGTHQDLLADCDG